MNIILASASPRRKEIMKLLFGENFYVEESSYEEDNALDLSPEELVMAHAKGKARNVSAEGIIISADSIVVHEGEVIGKPGSREQAISTLQKIRGQNIRVFTGITVQGSEELTEYEMTDVQMGDLSQGEIEKYVSIEN